jgi:hypothetical protein
MASGRKIRRSAVSIRLPTRSFPARIATAIYGLEVACSRIRENSEDSIRQATTATSEFSRIRLHGAVCTRGWLGLARCVFYGRANAMDSRLRVLTVDASSAFYRIDYYRAGQPFFGPVDLGLHLAGRYNALNIGGGLLAGSILPGSNRWSSRGFRLAGAASTFRRWAERRWCSTTWE